MTMHRQLSVDAAAQSAIKPYLDPGEVLLWAEKPPGWHLARLQLAGFLFNTAFVVLFAVVFLAEPRYRESLLAVLSGEVPLASAGFNQFFAAGFLIFVVVGLYGVIRGAKHLLTCWHTYYGLTAKRVIILQTLPPSQTLSLGPNAFSTISRTEKGDLGTIIFDEPKKDEEEKQSSGFKRLAAIKNPAGVEALIVSTLRPADTQGRY